MARPKSDIEPRIVDAARACFLASGVDGASLRQIARDAGTSIGMIYYYFPTKDDLFFGVVEDVYIELLAELELALDPSLPVAERIRRLSVRISQLSDTEVQVVRLVIGEAIASSARLDRLIALFQRGHLPLMVRTIADGMARGELDSRWHPMLLTVATFALCGAPHLVRRVVGERVPYTEVPIGEPLANQLVEILFSGIGKKSNGDSP
jgi:AcrR family transcriptional regulator